MRLPALGTLLFGGILLAACGSAGGPDPQGSADPYAAYNKDLPRVGAPLPAIAAVALDGRQVGNDSLHGRTILLNLWFFN